MILSCDRISNLWIDSVYEYVEFQEVLSNILTVILLIRVVKKHCSKNFLKLGTAALRVHPHLEIQLQLEMMIRTHVKSNFKETVLWKIVRNSQDTNSESQCRTRNRE